ncbi:MAG TPA: carboxypeptidase-like regulatory domain-containing protein, partial [bacterium]|nr:carboxypeptidase-like regulatory domain-containing protein [bacterium]
MRRLQVPRALRLILIAFWAITASTVVLAGSPSIAAPKVPVLGSLSTRVLDRAGAPVDALVIIKGSHSGIGRTDARGTYKVTVPPGRYEVSAFYAGRTTRPRKVTVAPNRSQQVTIRLSVAAGSPARAG